MMRGILIALSFGGVLLFPSVMAIVLGLLAAWYEPLMPFAIGMFIDVLYFVPHAGGFPLYTLGGFVVSVLAIGVHRRVRAGSIEG